MEDYKKLQEEWLKKNKPTVCPTIDNGLPKAKSKDPLIEEGLEGFVEDTKKAKKKLDPETGLETEEDLLEDLESEDENLEKEENIEEEEEEDEE